jgi:hypothetical protein
MSLMRVLPVNSSGRAKTDSGGASYGFCEVDGVGRSGAKAGGLGRGGDDRRFRELRTLLDIVMEAARRADTHERLERILLGGDPRAVGPRSGEAHRSQP